MSNLVLADTGPQLDGKINCIYAERKDDNAIIDWVYLAVNQSVLVYNQRELVCGVHLIFVSSGLTRGV